MLCRYLGEQICYLLYYYLISSLLRVFKLQRSIIDNNSALGVCALLHEEQINYLIPISLCLFTSSYLITKH